MRAESRRRPIAAGNTREMAEVTPMVAMAMLRAQGAGCDGVEEGCRRRVGVGVGAPDVRLLGASGVQQRGKCHAVQLAVGGSSALLLLLGFRGDFPCETERNEKGKGGRAAGVGEPAERTSRRRRRREGGGRGMELRRVLDDAGDGALLLLT